MFVFMGVIGGVFGALFNHMNFKLTIFRNKYIHSRLARVAEAVLVAVMSGTISFLIILVYNDCQPMTAEPKSYPVQIFCPDGHYSSTAGLFFQTPEAGAIHLFHDVEGTYSPATLAMYCVVFFMLACWTYGLAIPSGLFIPSLLIGAAWGRLFGQCLQILFPHAATGNITFGLPVMIVLMIAKWVGDCFNEGIYDSHIHLQGVPILGWEPPLMSANISAREVMSHPTIVFRTQEKVGRIVDILKKEAHNGFPVVEDYDPSSDVEYTSEIFQENTDIKRKMDQLKSSDFRDAYPRFPPIQQIHISPHERDFTIDLVPFMNPASHTIRDCASLPRIFRLFRALGLRHVVVINDKNMVLGMVTRKDLARYKVKVDLLRGKIDIHEINVSAQ
ncbi:CLCN7-like protein [Mya arenaria]|uniref:CLCN7-like protein n=1 Tax=Mya arenaria TaxID=6604 RepID=A0ABY7DMX8_MYAAR|nr:CLCN7-like protein [Mya arenaria]